MSPGVLSLLANWHWVDGELARAAQIYGRFNEPILRHHGIRTLINLRGANAGSPWYEAERKAIEALGGEFVDLRFGSRKLPPRETLLALLDVYDRMATPALVKCSGGADRTGLAAGLYLLHRNGPGALGTARRHLRRLPYLHFPSRYQRWIRAFFDYYEIEGDHRPVREWIAQRYSTEAFAAFMERRGQIGYWRPPRDEAAG